MEEALACRFCRFAPHFYPGSRSKQLWERQHEPITSSMRTLSAALRIHPGRRSPASMWQAAWQMFGLLVTYRDCHREICAWHFHCLTRPAGILLETDAPTHHPPVRKKNVAAALAAAFFNSRNSVQGTTRWTNSFMFGSWGTSTAATA